MLNDVEKFDEFDDIVTEDLDMFDEFAHVEDSNMSYGLNTMQHAR